MNEHILPVEEENEAPNTEKVNDNVVPFRILTGGKGPKDWDWLTPVPVGASFLCKRKNSVVLSLELFHVIFRSPLGAVLLLNNLNDVEVHFYVDPKDFCKHMELFEVIRTGEQENDTSDRSD